VSVALTLGFLVAGLFEVVALPVVARHVLARLREREGAS